MDKFFKNFSKNKNKNLIIASCFLIVWFVVMNVYMVQHNTKEPEEITYNEFIQMVEDGEIKSASINIKEGEKFKIEDQEGNMYITDNPKSTDFKAYLLQHDIEVEELDSDGNALVDVLLSVGQMAIYFALIMFMMKKMMPGNNSEEIVENIPKVTFDDIAGQSDNGGISKSAVGKVRLIPPTTNVNIKPIDYKDYMSDEDLYRLGLITEIKKEDKEIVENVVDTSKNVNINKEEFTNSTIEVLHNEVVIERPNEIVETDPVAILVNAAAKNRTVVPMELEIDLPSVDLFNIAHANFENGADKFIDVILSHIDYAILKDALRTALLSAYSYNLEQEDSKQE